MFTFIRIMSHQILHAQCQEPINHEMTAKSPVPHCPMPEGRQLNPWERELSRLARREFGNQPLRRMITTTLRGVQKMLPNPSNDLGTLQNLKVWWGNSTSTYKPPSVDLDSFAPTKRRKPNRWFK